MGNIFYINLTTLEVEKKKTPKYLKDNYLGGRGFNSRILFSFRRKIPKFAYSPENVLCISAGVFAGTDFPSAGRTTVSVLKSPVTNRFSDGNLGGHFGPALRLQGVDGLVITGRARNPTYLHISKGNVEFKSAGNLWMCGTVITETAIKGRERKNEYDDIKVLCIGQGGALQRFSAIPLCEDRAAGGGGTGAVFGSKNLKAISVSYNKENSIKPKSNKFYTVCEKVEEKIKSHPVYNMFRRYGTTSLIEIHSAMKYFPTRNWTQRTFKFWKKLSASELSKSQDEEALQKAKDEGTIGCRNCPIVCSNKEKIEYETLNCIGAKLGVDRISFVKFINAVYMNDAGLDVIQTTSIISSLMEMYETGVSNYPIEWGNRDQITTFLSDFLNNDEMTVPLSFRYGFQEGLEEAIGNPDFSINFDILSKLAGVEVNVDNFSEVCTKQFFMGTKGAGMSGIFPSNDNKGVALAAATSTRGADHLRSLPTLSAYADWYLGKSSKNKFRKIIKILRIPFLSAKIMKGESSVVVNDLYKTYNRTFGVPLPIVDQWKESGFLLTKGQIEGWESMVKFTQEMYALSDAISMCRFVSPWRFGIGPELISLALFNFDSRIFSWDELLRVGERIYAVERELLFYYDEALPDDTLPKRFFTMKGGLKEDEFVDLLQNYYKRCSYSEIGRPLESTLDNLDKHLFKEINYDV
jgi:aldehyde:ferredoxin oxidoreductase